jgi:hypothetical protein
VQLPFNTTLLNQWLVAVLAETLKLELETCMFFNLEIPLIFQETVTNLSNVVKRLEKLVNDCFKLYKFTFFAYAGQGKFKECCNILENLVPIMQFVLSDRAKNMIKALKQEVWKEQHSDLVQVKKEEFVIFKECPYNLEFWGTDEVMFYREHGKDCANHPSKVAKKAAPWQVLAASVTELRQFVVKNLPKYSIEADFLNTADTNIDEEMGIIQHLWLCNLLAMYRYYKGNENLTILLASQDICCRLIKYLSYRYWPKFCCTR